jgi:hypothetical protein
MSRSTSMYAWGAATHTSAGAGTAIRVGSYVEGQWLISIVSMSGTNPRLRPRWESAPGTVAATAGPFGTLRFMPTMLAWGRPAYSIGGTSAAIKFQSWFVGSW